MIGGSMGSREVILERVRRNQPATVELPAHLRGGITYADARGQFLAVLEQVGGHGTIVADMHDAASFVRTLPVVQDAQVVASLVGGIGGNLNVETCQQPHELASVDVAIMRGQFAVAENAAIWVTDEDLQDRALYFICQHLVLVVPAREIVHNMHEAYERLGSLFDQPGFSMFLSGPSKTADIEQSLVIGAQGPRSLTVVLVEGM
jgi:L-lactate dehydrogenase complex protein LldG